MATLSETTPEQARQILEDAQRERLEACQEEIASLVEQIEAIAKKHGCLFTAQPGLTPDGRIGANIVVVNAP